MKYLIVIDMQNDFIDGSLANPAAQVIVDKIAEYVANFDGEIIFTRDTHFSDYLETKEGKNLPVVHCVAATKGWQINSKIENAVLSMSSRKYSVRYVDKPTFGYVKALKKVIDGAIGYPTSIEVVGTCTDICVISNVLGLKEEYPEVEIIVHENMCAGLTEELHQAAINVMKSCQIKVV